MPRKSRIDAPGALHHIMARGIEGGRIYRDDRDRDNFLGRLEEVLTGTNTDCYAWALLPNHFHLLLRTGSVPISTVMRRLLGGYATWHNRRHSRRGHLFQNRYKSILCQEDAYLLELVRYIHLNPIRAGLVADLDFLDRYPYSGHSVLMGISDCAWQNTDKILGLFGRKRGSAMRAYRDFVSMGIGQGRRFDLTGGGLVRSMGGWKAMQTHGKGKAVSKGDERILGDGDFVESVLKVAEDAMEKRNIILARGFGLSDVAKRVAEVLEVDPETAWEAGKKKKAVLARSLLCYWAVRELGMTMTSLARRFDLSVTAIAKSVARGETLANEKGYSLLGGESLKV